MAYVWVPANAWAVGIGLLIMVAAAVLYFVAPHRSVNRRLGLMLLAQGFGFTAAWGLANLTTDRGHAYAWSILGYMAYAGLVPLYILFIARLRSPLARILAGRTTTWALWTSTLLAAAFVVARSDLFIADLTPLPDGRWAEEYGILGDLLPLVHGILPLYGLLVAWDQWRRSKGDGVMRRQATSYLVAFGWRDLNWAVVLLVVLPILGSYEAGQTPAWIIAIMGSTELVFVGLLGYAVLSAQLFDIDLKVKWTLNRGTLAAVFVASFFVVSEIVAGLLSDRIGLVSGVLATGLLVFLLAPLQRFADTVADRAMPRVVDSPEYRQERKEAIYRAALVGALDDGAITTKERGMLAALALELGLDPVAMHRLEATATQSDGDASGTGAA